MQSTIKLSEILSKVKPFSEYVESVFSDQADLEALESALQTGTYLGWSEAFNERVKVMPVNTWICTDTLVGVNSYYLDGEFVALSFQSARKSKTEFKWTSIESATKVQALIRKISAESQLPHPKGWSLKGGYLG
jgi:hypothetical protein